LIPVLESTIEKPLTAIDYIAALDQCEGIREIQIFADQVPMHIRQDERFAGAVARLIKAIRTRKAAA
jgi:hypothetical protein